MLNWSILLLHTAGCSFFFCFPPSALLFSQLVVAMLSSLSLSFLLLVALLFFFILFSIFTCFSFWMSTSLWLPISSCANFSLQLSLVSQLLCNAVLSLHYPAVFCMSFSGSFIFSPPCYTALATVTTSQDLIWTLLPQLSPLLSPPSSMPTLPPSFLGPCLRFLSSSPSLSLTVSSPLPASLLLFKGRSCQAWKSCSAHHLQVRIVFNESYKPKAENWHADKFTHTPCLHIHHYPWLPNWRDSKRRRRNMFCFDMLCLQYH